MGETGGTDRVLPTAGTRLGAQPPMGVSTLEPGHMPSPRTQEKHLHVRVKLLDCTVEAFDMEPRCDGQTLLTQLWERLHLLESDYFGLEFQNGPSSWVWLEPTKPIVRQVRRPKSALFRLAVKFFPPDPGQLREEYTRYLFALQLKRDLLEERLPCASTTAALLTSHFLQAEVGDYDEAVDREHLGTHAYLPGQGPCLEKTLEFHRRHTGQTPAESDFQVLEIARKLEMYGIRFHTASDREGTKINLAVSHMGVLVFQGTTKINTFNWSKVRKLSFKRRRFLIKLHPEVHGPYQDTLEFLLGSRDACKNFWKICVEHHTFFRLLAQPKPKAKAVLFSRGSSFRYSGRTQRQLVEYVKDGGAARLPYERRHSKAGPSVRALTTDLPKQSISFNESLRTSSWSSANTCFYPLPASPPARPSPPGLKDSSGSTPEPPGPAAEKSSMAVVAGPSPQPASQPGPPAPPSGPGGNSCPVLSSRGSVRAGGQRLGALDRDAGRGLECRAACAGDGGEGTFSTGPGPAGGGQWCHWQRCGGGPVFTSTSTPLQVSEEFIDDDPADISFFAGSSEAFSFLYGSWVTQEPRGPAWSPAGPPLRGPGVSQHPQSTQSSPDTCSMEAADRSVENDFDFEEESDFDGDVHLAATSELLEVKAQASLMHSLLSPSECSSLPDVQLQGGPSETSSMANFPACSVRSDASSALQFSDVLEQLGQLNYPPPAAQGSSSSDSDSWDSGAEAPLNVGLFLSRPFA